MLKTNRVVIVGVAITNKDGKRYKNVYARDVEESDISNDTYSLVGYKTYSFFVPLTEFTEIGQEITICYTNGKYEYLQL